MKTEILWQPTVTNGERLAVLEKTDQFILHMQRAFQREWPMHLTTKDIERLEGMAAATSIIGNPYMSLLQYLKRHKAITVWPEYGEDHGI